MKNFREITSYEKACEYQGLDPATLLPDVSKMPASHAGLGRSNVAYTKLCVIRDSIVKKEDGTIPKANFHDTDEEKWRNWMEVEATEEVPSGVGLSFNGPVIGISITVVPARLLCQTEEQSEFFFTEHKALWEEYILHRD